MVVRREHDLDLKRRIIVSKPMIANGRHLRQGDQLQWKRWGISPRRVWQMIDQRKLRFADEDDLPEEETPAEVSGGPESPVPSETPQSSPDISEVVPGAASSSHTWSREELDEIDSMPRLREIAESIGAPGAISKALQRDAILNHQSGI